MRVGKLNEIEERNSMFNDHQFTQLKHVHSPFDFLTSLVDAM